MRCFVAVDPSPEVRTAIARAQAALRAAASAADVRWTDASAFHLTLKFLGAVADERVPAVAAALARAVAGAPPLVVAAGGLGAFPSHARARVLWAGITAGADALAALAAAVDRSLVPLGMPPEARPFHAHVTIGRVRSPRGGRTLAEALGATGAEPFGSWRADEVVLYQSRLRPTGAEYVRVAGHALGTPA